MQMLTSLAFGGQMLSRQSGAFRVLLGVPVLASGWMAVGEPVQAASLETCAQSLQSRGYTITGRDTDDGIFEFDAIKNNQSWDIKTDRNCRVILERQDS
jgi:hypothetical protein